MKLQIGSSVARGIYKTAEWVNLDLFPAVGVDVVGSGFVLPFATGSIDEIHCIHVLEHVTRDKYPFMLREMHRVLKPGGSCYVETPDFKSTIDNLVDSFKNGDLKAIHVWTTSIYGKNEREGMAHHWGFYEGLLRREFRIQGFKEVERLLDKADMISSHYKQEPVLLVRGMK